VIRLIAIGMVFASLVLMAVDIKAQDSPLESGVAPDPALCTLSPRTIEEIQTLMDKPDLEPLVTPTVNPGTFKMPGGFDLFEDERNEVVKDLKRAVACVNTGNPLKVFSAYTDRYVVELVNRLGGLTPDVVQRLQSVLTIAPEDRTVILSVGDAVLLDDNRVAIVVLGDDPTDNDPPSRRLFYLTEVKPGRWLIDEVVNIQDDTTN
jgi:hypothetical protein